MRLIAVYYAAPVATVAVGALSDGVIRPSVCLFHRVYFKRGVQTKCGVQDYKCGVQN